MSGIVEARARLEAGDAAGAVALLQPDLDRDDLSDDVLKLGARALRTLTRHAEAARLLAAVAVRNPDNAVVAHNLAAALGDAGDHEGAAAAARRAIALRDLPESWLVLGRALQTAGDLPGARDALTQAIARRPAYADALQTLSQLIWMSTGDAPAALEPLHRALRASASADLAALTCGVIKDVAGPEQAWEFIRDWTGKGSTAVELAAAAASAWLDADRQALHAKAAVTLAPQLPEARHAWATARLAKGETEAALQDLEQWLARAPRDQVALGLQRTAWRLAGRPEALGEAAMRRLVRTWDIETPTGWSSRTDWLDALAAALRRLHSFRAEPFGQSVRAGAQSRTDPRWAGEPVIDATFAAFAGPLADYVQGMDPSEPMGAVRAREAVVSGAWSVRLTSGGWHSDHVHPRGWISSAFYVTVPEQTPSEPVGGWLRFGAVHLGPALDLPAEYRIEPRPGRLALFPSYLWHGTEPFSGAGERLTIAFDGQPAPVAGDQTSPSSEASASPSGSASQGKAGLKPPTR